MMKLGVVIPYLKKIQKIYKSRDTPLELCWHQHFFYRRSFFYRIQRLAFKTQVLILLSFFWVFKGCFNKNMVVILMKSAKLATPDLVKIKVFWNKCYELIISVHDVTNKVFSRDWNYIVDVLMWPKFYNSSEAIYKRSYQAITILILQGLDQKNLFFLRAALGSTS